MLQRDDTEAPVLRELDVVAGVTEIVKDAGPMYLHHVKHWSNSELPANITEMLQDRFGQVRHACGACMYCTCVPVSARVTVRVARCPGRHEHGRRPCMIVQGEQRRIVAPNGVSVSGGAVCWVRVTGTGACATVPEAVQQTAVAIVQAAWPSRRSERHALRLAFQRGSRAVQAPCRGSVLLPTPSLFAAMQASRR